ncbi:hypothetical protein [Chitinimonas lacunae]|uniref:KTSC domain-containing protein n=1 Tax=Chitinimonas lacunae TaxID=1963018 RepID=A0ABV8MM77_9NEIS
MKVKTKSSIYHQLCMGSNINAIGEPILYEKNIFVIVDAQVPDVWVWQESNGSYYMDSPESSRSGFYEKYFNKVPSAVQEFEEYRCKHGLPPRLTISQATH